MPYRRILAIACVWMLFGAPVPAQVQIRVQVRNANPAAAQLAANEQGAEGVYVRDSAVVVEKMALAERMENLKEWHKSADVYQEILEQYADRVVAVEGNQRYKSVAWAVQERLAKWPVEGLDVYRARYESPAQTMRQNAPRGDASIAVMHQVLTRYFVTDAARDAGLELIDLYFERGQFAAAMWIGQQLLEWHPNLSDARPGLIYKTAIVANLSNNAPVAQTLLKDLQDNHATARASIRGSETVLATSLAEELQSPGLVATRTDAESWPTFLGSDDRARLSSAAGRPGAHLFRIPYVAPTGQGRPSERDQSAMQASDRRSGLTLGIFPVVDGDELFFQDGARIYAVNLGSDVPLPGWQNTYGSERRGQYATNNPATQRYQQYTLCVTGDAVLGILGQISAANRFGGVPTAGPRLVCLDRKTGRERWIAQPSQFPREHEALRTLVLSGTPVVVGDNVYCAARSGKGTQFDDCYVLAFSLNDGKLRWSCYIVSANVGTATSDGEISPTDSNPQLAFSAGRLYVQTNLGATAAIDAYSGTIAWLSLYPRGVSMQMNARAGIQVVERANRRQSGQPWTCNAPVVGKDALYVMPADADMLLVYDITSGKESARINLTRYDRRDLRPNILIDTLLAVTDDGNLLLAGDGIVTPDPKVQPNGAILKLNWRAYDDQRAGRPDDPAILWKQTITDGIRGRGFVAGDSLFVPTASTLQMYSLKAQRLEHVFPPTQKWAESEGPGNVLVTQNYVILAGSDGINGYTDMALAKAKFHREITAAPTDPEPRLRFAEVMFVAGEQDLALEQLDDAATLLGGLQSMRAGPARDRLFSDALTFAQKLSTDPDPVKSAMARGLFDRARAAATSASQMVDYRISHTVFLRRLREYDKVVELCQEILADSNMRTVTLSMDGSNPVQAGSIAEQSIAQLIKSIGPECYAPFEQAAVASLEKARASDKPEEFLAIAQVYPNSSAAAQAAYAAAQIYEKQNEPRLATQVLRQIYFKYPDAADTNRILEAIARNALKVPNRLEVAIARISQGARLVNEPFLEQDLILPDGGRIPSGTSFSKALEDLRAYQSRLAAQSLPDFRLPSAFTAKPFSIDAGEQPLEIDDVTTIVLPLSDPTIPSSSGLIPRHDRLVTWSSATGLRAFAVGEATPLFAANAEVTEAPIAHAWFGDNLLVWGSAHLFCIDEKTGKILWQRELSALPQVEVVSVEIQPSIAGADEATETGALVDDIEDFGQNRIVPPGLMPPPGMQGAPFGGQRATGPELISALRPVGDRVIFSTTHGRLVSLEARNGQIVWQTRLSNFPIERLHATEDFAVVRINSSDALEIAALDSFTGRLINRWAYTNRDLAPINFTLSADGTVVLLMQDRIWAKDLYETGSESTFTTSTVQDLGGKTLFGSNVEPNQLLTAEGRILAISDGGVTVRMYSLETGQPITHAVPGVARAVSVTLPTKAQDAQVGMQIVGPYLYVVGRASLCAFNLSRSEDTWSKQREDTVAENFRDIFVGQDYVVLIDQSPMGGTPNGLPQVPVRTPNAPHRLLGFSRRTLVESNNRESGQWVFDYPVRSTSAIIQWQGVNGGFYFRTADGKVHFLKGVRE